MPLNQGARKNSQIAACIGYVSQSLEGLSRSRTNYYGRFLTDGATGIGLIVFSIWVSADSSAAIRALQLVGGLAAGIFCQGFIEYAFHRWLFHEYPTRMAAGHGLHHEAQRAFVSLPWPVTQLIFAALWLLMYAFFRDIAFTCMATSGIVLRFMTHASLHHSFHHSDFSFKPWRRMRAFHRIHHRFPDRNYGLTSPFWDYVMGTHYQSGRLRESQSLQPTRLPLKDDQVIANSPGEEPRGHYLA